MPGGVYKDNIFCGENALYVNGEGNDWPDTVWRDLEELNDEKGWPIKGWIVFDKGFEPVDIS